MPSTRKRAWLANLEHDPNLILHLKGAVKADVAARARPITDEGERRAVLSEVVKVWRRQDLETMVRLSPLVEVTFPGLEA